LIKVFTIAITQPKEMGGRMGWDGDGDGEGGAAAEC